MSAEKVITPRAIDPNFAQSLADGLTESYEAYRDRLYAASRSEVPAAELTDGEDAS